jgi:hypothetical protein
MFMLCLLITQAVLCRFGLLLIHSFNLHSPLQQKISCGCEVAFNSIQIIQSTRCSSFTGLLFDVYVWLNMFRASPCPSSGAYSCTRSLWFYRWKRSGYSVVDHGLEGQTMIDNTPTASLQQ